MPDQVNPQTNDNIIQLQDRSNEVRKQIVAEADKMADDAENVVREVLGRYTAEQRARAEHLKEDITQDEQTLTRIKERRNTLAKLIAGIFGAVVVLIGVGFVAGYFEKHCWTNFAGDCKQLASATGPTLTDVQVQKIFDDRLASTNKSVVDLNAKADGIQASVSGLEKSMGDAKASISQFSGGFDTLKVSTDATKTAVDNASTAAAAAQTSADAAKAAAEKANATAGNLLGNVQSLATATGQLADQTSAVDKRVAALEAKLGSGAVASATPSSTAATASTTTASPTSFDWPTDLMKRQMLVYTACGDIKDGWSAVDKTISDQLLASFTAVQAAKYFGEGGNCQAFLTLATNATNIKRQFDAQVSQPEQPAQASLPAPSPQAVSGAMSPAPAMPQAAGPVGRGCPALGSADFLRLNPRPAGEGWEMVAQVPGKPCGGWHRKRFANN